jgi:hypothetical protein
LLLASITFSCTNKSSQTKNSPLHELRVLEENYPRSFFFRVSERTYEPYEVWESDMNRLIGIMGKAMDEENRGLEQRNPEFFTRFKKNHPDQVVLLHFNGNARLPDYRMEKFHAGHWLYFNGATILSDLSAEEEVSEIKVSDARLFKLDAGRFMDLKEDIGLCELDEQGNPDWNKSEQVQLLDADTIRNTIKIKRGCYGTLARSFPAGKSYAAAHVHEGPWGENSGLMWLYNYSTLCPKDADAKNCKDRLVEDMLQIMLPGGVLGAFDGVEFDVMFDNLRTHVYTKPDFETGTIRMPDSNNDKQGDDGVFNGFNSYGEGVIQFLKELREGLGEDRIIMADGYNSAHVRGAGILNGIESEGWPHGNDVRINNWSSGINNHMFWDSNGRDPKLSFMNHRWWRSGSDIGVERLVIAASCLTNSAHAMADRPKAEPGQTQVPLWDELVMGQENRRGWLGKPLGPTRCLAMTGQDLLEGASPSLLIERMESEDPEVRFTVDGKKIKIEGKSGEIRKNFEFTIRDVPCPSEDFTLFFTIHGESMKGGAPEISRLVNVGIKGRGYQNGMFCYAGKNPFQAVFYFNSMHKISPDKTPVSLQIEVEGTEPVWISDIKAFAHPDARVREFENGIVLANPAPQPYSFDLKNLFGKQEFRRLKGSPAQDTVTNNGAMAEDIVQLQGKDALFLVKVN